MNVPVQCPSVSSIFLDAQEVIGCQDEVVHELLAERDQNVENAGTISDENSVDEDGEDQSVGDPIQFAFPKLVDNDADKLRRAYINNVDVMTKKQRHSPDFKSMWDYLKDGTLPARTRA